MPPPELRYERLTQRKLLKTDTNLRNRPATKEEAESRDFAELENLNKGATIAMADYTVVNTKTLSYLKRQLNEIYKTLLG